MSLLKPSLDWLLIFVPITIGLEYFSEDLHTYVFFSACLAIIPLAGWLGTATEHLAERTNEGLGGLLNATFGNAAELIIALVALKAGLHDVVKASLTGSIIGNILLVWGVACIAGGVKRESLEFNITAARTQASMLTLATIGLVIPALYYQIATSAKAEVESSLSLEISVVLLVTYGLSLLFSLHTHKELFSGSAADIDEKKSNFEWSLKKSFAVLLLSTACIAWMSEILVGSVEHAAHALGMSNIFVGVIIVAIVGNAAEHSTAVLVARKNRMDLSIGIAVGSSIQIALFVAPLLVLVSYVIAPEPMDLVFSVAEVMAIALSVLITGQITGDGKTNWFEGVQLISVYLILALMFYFLPETGGLH